MSALTDKYNKNKRAFDINIDGFEFKKLSDLEEDKIYPLLGFYINVKGKFGDHPVFISDGILVDVPPHMTEDTKEMLKDPEMLEAIRAGRIGFHVYQYTSKTYKKECYAVALDDAADKE